MFAERYAKTLALTRETRGGLSDLQFTGAYRVPFQFREKVRTTLATGAFYQRSEGPMLVDLDSNRLIDLTGSYGVNLFGNDFYKRTMAEGAAIVADLGGVLGSFHPVVADNVRRLTVLSGMDEVSFHMSGTEAVMQAVGLPPHPTGRGPDLRVGGGVSRRGGGGQAGIGDPAPKPGQLPPSGHVAPRADDLKSCGLS